MNVQRAYVRQIRTIYDAADALTRREGHSWYQKEHREACAIARDTGLTIERVCACLAILSPRCQWPRVKASCRALLLGNDPGGFFGRNLAKANHIIEAHDGIPIDPRKAPKTWAFWQNLWHPNDPRPVTLDSWMLRAHGLPVSIRFPRYRTLADCYRRAARELSILPNQLQATVWLHVRRTSSNGKERRTND